MPEHATLAGSFEEPDFRPADGSPQALIRLPFIDGMPGGLPVSCWRPPPAQSYRDAYRAGRWYAAQYLAYLKANLPAYLAATGTPIVSRIAADVDFTRRTAEAGYWRGFFAHLERCLFAHALESDVYYDAFMIDLSAEDALDAEWIQDAGEYPPQGDDPDCPW